MIVHPKPAFTEVAKSIVDTICIHPELVPPTMQRTIEIVRGIVPEFVAVFDELGNERNLIDDERAVEIE